MNLFSIYLTNHIIGIFIVPISGLWRVSYSLYSSVTSPSDSGVGNSVFLYHNNARVPETLHLTYSANGTMGSTGGRELIAKASAGDSIYLKTTDMNGDGFYQIKTCFEIV